MNTTNPAAPVPTAPRHPLALYVGGGLGLMAVGALATALILKSPSHEEAPLAATAPVTAPADMPASALQAAVPPTEQAPVAPAPKPVHRTQPKPAPAPVVAQPAPVTAPPVVQPAPVPVAAAPVCTICGVVESVTPVTQKGQGSGIGAVAGGVLGGVVGHQMGEGSGKKALTVLGAIGGGLAGNEIEKRQRASTVYQIRIRMNDGTVRTITQSTELPVGQHVHVEGSTVTATAG